MIDWTVSVGNILTIAGVVVTFIITFYKMRDKLDTFTERVMVVEKSMKELLQALTDQRVMQERLTAFDNRVHAQGLRLDANQARLERHLDWHLGEIRDGQTVRPPRD